MTSAARSWQGVWALGDCWLTYAGPLGPTAPHAHHAMQLIGSRDGDDVHVSISGSDAVGPVLAIPSNTRHQIMSATDDGWIVFVEPNSTLGRTLAPSAGMVVARLLGPEPGSSFSDFEAFAIRAAVAAAAADVTSQREAIDWATERALELIPRLIGDGRVSVLDIARQVGVSSSRLSHVFNTDLGTTLPTYLRWVRLRLAVQWVARGHSLTRAAHCAGFADSAHLTRSFRTMFGLAPSQAVGVGEWLVG